MKFILYTFSDTGSLDFCEAGDPILDNQHLSPRGTFEGTEDDGAEADFFTLKPFPGN